MRIMFTVHHNEHVSSRSFEEVLTPLSLLWAPWKTLDLQCS